MALNANTAFAQGADEPDAAALSEGLTVLWILLASFLVFFMQAGFAMVESGFSRAKNAANLLMKNLMDFVAGSLLFFALGFGFMFGSDMFGLIGRDGFFLTNIPLARESATQWAFFLFQTMFAAAAATIVSGAVAERLKFSAYLVYTVFITAFIYPISGHWVWGGGWLANLGFIDFAGSAVVHSVGGWAGLAGAMVLGPRIGKFNKDGSANAIPGHSLTLAALGVFILWFGWYGFNPGSTVNGLSAGNAYIAVTTTLSASAGAFSALITYWLKEGRPSTEMALNGALGGLVAITAGTASVTFIGAILIGAVAGPVLVLSLEFLERVLKVDDPVGAVAVHGFNGAWGALAVGLFAAPAVGAITDMGDAAGLFYGGGFTLLLTQLIGIVAIGVWAFTGAYLVFKISDLLFGIRISPQEELEGLDISEHGTTSYPEFGSTVTARPAQRMMPGANA
ncbi:MAG: ammonium transporter [Chloroflexi bacterium]|nr:ammonium transporter [Chloroflexota bacterium]